MDKKDAKSLIEKKLEQSEKSIRNKNSIEALFSLFPPSSALWKVLFGSKEAIETKKSRITQETILDILIAIDNKLETGSTDSQKFKVLLDGVVSFGDVSGLKARTSNPIVSKLFSKEEIEIILKNMSSTSQATTPIIRFVVIFTFILSFILVILGIVLICIGAPGAVKLSFFGQSIESTIGIAAIFIGVVLFVKIVLRAFKSLETLGQTDKSIQDVARVIWIGTPRLSGQNHFYTTSGNERNDAINVSNYRDENIACYVFSTQHQDSVPLYRLYNPTTHDHFYTTSATERTKAINVSNYRDENIACYVFSTQHPDSVPLYRLYNPTTHDHFYTTSSSERNKAISHYGHGDENISCYVYDSPTKGSVPLYRLYWHA